MQRFARPVLEEFEPRILYSADLAVVVAGLAPGIGVADGLPLVQDLQLQQPSQPGAATLREIAFVDLSIADANTLISGLQAQRDGGRSVEIVTIDAGEDGIARISATLDGRSDITAVHVLSHGADGVLQLGSVRLDAATLLSRAGELAHWSSALTQDADLLLYGCDVAASAGGKQLVAGLAALTGADVAASTDLTGAAAWGGNWTLEFGSGRIDAAAAIDAAAQQAWAGTLAVAFSSESSGETTSATTSYNFSHNVNSGSDRLLLVELVTANGVGVSAVNFNGGDLTFLSGVTSPGNGVRAELWYLVAPNVTSGTVDVTLASASTLIAGATSFSGVNQTTPFGTPVTNTGNNWVPIVVVAADSGDLVVDIVAAKRVAGHSIGPGQTENFARSQGTGTTDIFGVSSREAGAASVTMGHGFLGVDPNWAAIAVEIDQVGTVAQIGAAQDTYIRSGSTTNYGASSSLVIDRAGGSALGNGRALLQFDLGTIPVGATITGATLQMQATQNGGAFDINIHNVTEAWVQGSGNGAAGVANWNQRLPGTNWTAGGGGSFDPAPVATLSTGAIGQHSWNITTLAQAWHAGSTANHGIIIGSPNSGTTTTTYSSSEGTTPPRLVITYTLPSNPTPVLTSNGGGATALISVAENATAVTTVTATDADLPAQTLSYSITGGADAARFVINASSGELRFVVAPDYEAADDAGANHSYEIVVQVSDGLRVDSQALTIDINNVDEPPSAAAAVVSGTQDSARVFVWADFGVSDIDSSIGANTALRFETLPADGRLQVFNGAAWLDVVPMQTVNKAQIDAASLRFVPDTGESGNNSFAAPGVGNGRQDYAQFSLRPLQTTPISIVNPGAQSNTLGEGTWTNTTTGWVRTGAGAGAQNFTTNEFALDHDNGFFVNAGGVLTQSLASTFSSGRNFSLGFDAGWRADIGFEVESSFRVELWAGSTLLGRIDETGVDRVRGEFVSGVLAVDGAAFAAADGQALSIVLSCSSVQAQFDNFVLTSYAPANSLGAAATMTIDIASAQTAPLIQSNGGGAASSVSLAENLTAVTTVSAIDADLPAQTLSYSIVAGGDGALFAIDALSGGLSFITAPDREAALDSDGDSVYLVTVRASDSTLADTQTLTVTVFDVNESGVGAITDTDAAANVVSEIAGVGTLVGLDLQAIDADASDNVVSFVLSDDQGGRFVIDASSGVVRVAAALDFETQPTHIIVVTATSSDGSNRTVPFLINLLDANEAGVGTLSDADAAANSLAENASLGSLAGISAFATDPDLGDNISYSLVDDAGGRFVIAAGSGVVTLGAALDAETASSHVIVVRADSSDGSFNSQAFTIVVQDVNESALSVLADVDAAADQIAEGASAGSVVGVTARAVDADRSNNAVTYTLDNNAGGRFAINATSGVVSLARGIQEEGLAAHLISVRATSADASTSTRDFSITVGLANDHAPVISSGGGAATATLTVDEGSTAVVQVVASDADLPAPTLVYSISGGADAALFALDANSGGLRFIVAPDAEAAADAGADNTYHVDVLVSDGGRTDTQALTVHVNDVNEFAVGAITDSNASANVVSENANPGTGTGLTAYASDADHSNSSLAYTLDNNAGGRFVIDAGSGAVRLARAIAEEGFASHTITVRASSADGSSSTQDLVIAVTLINDHAPVIVSEGGGDAATLSVDEGQLQVTVVSASDADLPAPTLVYSISGGADAALFALDANSGGLRFIVAPDAEAAADAGADNTYEVEVLVSDGGRTDAQALTVQVNDVNEFAVGAIADPDAAANVISENASVGSGTGLTAYASDADHSNSSLTYTLDNNAGGRFVIDAGSGVVSLARGIQEEGLAAHLISVRATSADASFSTRDFSITVGLVNDHAPLISSGGGAATATVVIDEGSTAVTQIVASDADLPTPALVYSISGGADAALFALDASSGALRFIIAPDAEAPADADRDNEYTVGVSVSDGLQIDLQTLSVQVSNVDEAPQWASPSLTVSEGGSAVPWLGVVDVDSSAGQLRIQVQGLAGGQFESRAAPGVAITGFTLADLNAGQVIFFSDGGEAAPRFLLLLADATSSLPAQAVTVNFTPVNDLPVVAPISLGSIAEDGSLVVDLARLLSGASDADGDVLRPAGLRVAADGSVTDLGGGRWRIDAAPDWSGALTLVYDVSDGTAVTMAQATLDVLAVNDAPRFTSQGGATAVTQVVDENGRAVGRLAATDVESAAALRFAIDGGADAALFTIDAQTGALEFVAAPDHETTRDADANGRYELIVLVSDGALTAQQAWQVTVANVDEAPVITRHALLLSEQGVTLVLQAADPDSGTAALVYEVSNSRGGAFELRDQPGQTLKVFSQSDVDAGRVVFVADASVDTPTYTLVLTDGLNRVDAGTPQRLGSVAVAPAPTVAAASELAPAAPVSDDKASVDLPPAAANDAGTQIAIETAPAATEAALPVYEAAPRAAGNGAAFGVNPAQTSAAGRGAAGGTEPWGAAQIALALPGDGTTPVAQRFALDLFGGSGSGTFAQALDEVRRQMNDQSAPVQMNLATTALVSSGLSVGYVLWLARGGVLVASLMSSVPAWASVDPLPVLAQMRRAEDGAADEEAENSDPLERLFSRARRLLAPVATVAPVEPVAPIVPIAQITPAAAAGAAPSTTPESPA